MSIVCALRLNQKDALIAADTLYSENNRAVKYEGKIFDIGDYTVSFCGDLRVRDSVVKEARVLARDASDIGDFLDIIKDVYTRQRERFFTEGPLRQEAGYTFEEFRKGNIPAERLQQLERYYRDSDSFQGAFLIVGENKKIGTLELHKLVFPGTTEDSGYFAVIGPTKSRESVIRATREIQSKTTNVYSLDGQEIGLVHGLKTVLTGVQKGWPERGIGGKTQLVMRSGNLITNFDYTHTTFMHNLLELERRGDLEPAYVSEVLTSVTKDPANKDDFEKIADDVIVKLLGTGESERKRFIKLMEETIWIGDQFQH